LIEAEDIVGGAAQPGEDSRRAADAGGVFVEGDVAGVVPLVFNTPVFANGVGGLAGKDGAIGQAESAFQTIRCACASAAASNVFSALLHGIERGDMACDVEFFQQFLRRQYLVRLLSISICAGTSAASTAKALSICRALTSLKASKLRLSTLPSNA
jgi:hypothetical protein